MADEHQSLRLTVESLSDKIREKEEERRVAVTENANVLQELIAYKAALADRANDQLINKCAGPVPSPRPFQSRHPSVALFLPPLLSPSLLPFVNYIRCKQITYN